MTEEIAGPIPFDRHVSAQHWNGNTLCAVDVETTGLDVRIHEMIQIAILPLNSRLEPRKDVMPLYLNLQPDYPENIDKAAIKVNKLNDIMKTGFDRLAAIDMFLHWIESLHLPLNKGGFYHTRIIPLGHNVNFDISFIQKWLGKEEYDEWFFHIPRDTMTIAAYINDRYADCAETVLFSKLDLVWCCKRFNISMDRAHDSLQDCLATAELYKHLLRVSVP